MFTDKAEIEESLCEVGIDKKDAKILAQQARPAIQITPHLVDDESTVPPGVTKIGGRPDLPEDMEWPWRPPYSNEDRIKDFNDSIANPDKRWRWATPEQRAEMLEEVKRCLFAVENPFPLSFIAQINFADMCAAGEVDVDMPREGMLYLFYDLSEQPWGYDPKENIGFSVIYHPSTKELSRREMPDRLAWLHSGRMGRIFTGDAAYMLSPLPAESTQWELLGLSDETRDEVTEWFDELDCEPAHQLGGWPNIIQNSMETQCALVSAGHYCGDSDAYKNPELASVRAEASQWLLLAQIESDDAEDGWMWGDSGRLYIWIKRSDLIDRRFERAQLIQQCH